MSDRSFRSDDHKKQSRDEDFVRDVLGRTSGSPCERAANLLPALTDDVLEDMDRQLVQAHLEHCPGCRALAVTLGWMEPLLPKMALLDPGPEFMEKVLDRTSRAPAGVSAGPIIEPAAFGPAGLMDRLGRWWGDRILRPVFPMQVAYAATVILVLLVGTPVSPFREAPGKLLQTVQAGPGSLPILGPVLNVAASEGSDWVGARVDRASGMARGEVVGAWKRADDGFRSRIERSAPNRHLMMIHLDALGENLRKRQLSDAGYDLHQVLQNGQRAWAHWWNEESIDDKSSKDIERRTP